MYVGCFLYRRLPNFCLADHDRHAQEAKNDTLPSPEVRLTPLF